jgi:hypothetical protein
MRAARRSTPKVHSLPDRYHVTTRANLKAIFAQSQPLVVVMGYSDELPRVGSGKIANTVVHGWTLGGLLRYASGLPIPVPTANNNLTTVLPMAAGTFANRVPGPLIAVG